MPSPSRSARRNAPQRLGQSRKGAAAPHGALACRWLAHGRAAARRRAWRLGAPAPRRWLRAPSIVALLQWLDPTGELAADRARLIAAAVAAASDRRLVRSCRPLAAPVKQGERHRACRDIQS